MVRGIYCARTGTKKDQALFILEAQMDVPGFGTAPRFKKDYEVSQLRAEKRAQEMIVKEGAVAVNITKQVGTWACAPESRTWGPLEVLTGKRAPHPVEKQPAPRS